MFRRCTTAVAALLAVLALAPPAGATWSIVLVNKATHEIAIGGATCLTNLDLKRFLPVMLVEVGGACAQAQVDSNATQKIKIWNQLLLGTPVEDILAIVLTGDPSAASRQYGIVDMSPGSDGYTGTSASEYKGDIHGTVGDITYAIQGNILTCAAVLELARDAVLATPGTLSDKLMAGMEAARSMGGDGRCSCSIVFPTSCGCPPPTFTKSAHIGFLMTSRPGDIDGVCNGLLGCANGEYWMSFNIPFQTGAALDPVFQLQALYNDFRTSLPGHPDGLKSTAALDDGEVLGDGLSSRQLAVALADVDGLPISHGGASFTLLHAPGSAGLSHLGAVTDHGDGTYTLQVVAGAGTGTDLLSVRVDDGFKSATLYPYPMLVHRQALEASAPSLSVTATEGLDLDLLGPTGSEHRLFVAALSASGTQPGFTMASGLDVPLNVDMLLHLTYVNGASGFLGGSHGALDALGHAHAVLGPTPGMLAPLVGLQVACAWFTVRPADFASNPILVEITP